MPESTDAQLQVTLTAPVSRGPRGVGGWLLWFCVIATFIAPIIGLIEMSSSDLTDPATLIRLGLCLLSLVAGINLWMVTRKAIPILRVFFISFGLFQVYTITLEISSLNSPDGMRQLSLDIRTFIVAVVWALYFHNSDRVKNTYGVNL